MNSRERAIEARKLARLFGAEYVVSMIAERESRDPSITEKKQRYSEQAEAVSTKLNAASLTTRQRERLEWHLQVLQFRAEHGPVIHSGYYDFNLLPEAIASSNPQHNKIFVE